MGVADVLLGRLADGELVIIDGGSHRKWPAAASRIWPVGGFAHMAGWLCSAASQQWQPGRDRVYPLALGRPECAARHRPRTHLSAASVADELDRQFGRVRPLHHILQLPGAGYFENHLGLAIPQPGSKVNVVEAGQHSGDGRVRHLGGDLAAPHAQIGPDHHRQLHRHEDTVERRCSMDAVRGVTPGY